MDGQAGAQGAGSSEVEVQMSKNRQHISWPHVECFTTFIRGVYSRAGLTIPDEFYPEVEIDRVCDVLMAKGMGVNIE